MVVGNHFWNIIGVIALLCSYHLGSTQPQITWEKKVDSTLLQEMTGNGEADFLVYFNEQPDLSGEVKVDWTKSRKGHYVLSTLRQHATTSQRDIVNYLNSKQIPYSSLFIVNIVKTRGNLTLIKELALREEVKYIMVNPSIMLDFGESSRDYQSLRAEQWGIGMINADKVWEMGIKGEGIVIGGQDTGYEWDHPALKTKYRGYISKDEVEHNYNWHDAVHEINPLHEDVDPDPSVNPCGLDIMAPCDDHNHGTHTMGTMVGSAEGFDIGIAPDAKWCGCRNMDRGYGSPFTYLECFQWFLAPTDLEGMDPDPGMSPHVITNSWACPPMEGCSPATFEVLNTAVKNLKLAGIVVVVSAGNNGSDCSTVSSPAAIFDDSFTVGAVADNDTIARFSSRGPVISDASNRTKPNVVAPGVRVLSSIKEGEYREFSGTSMAGPHVSGVVALILNANPQLEGKVDIIEDIIESTAVPKTSNQDCGDISGTIVPNNTYGYGRIDALAAVEEAISLIVGPKDIVDSVIEVYPNPVENILNFGLEYLEDDVNLELFDINGRQIYHRSWYNQYRSTTTIDVTDLSSGLYIYRIRSDDFTWQGKVVKY